MATNANILAWSIPWTEEPGRLQSMGLKRVRHDSVTEHTHTQENTLMRGLNDFFFPTFTVADKRQCVFYKGEISAQDTTRTENC